MRARLLGIVLASASAVAALSTACSSGSGGSPSPSPTPLPGACAANMPVDTIVDSSAHAVIASGDSAYVGQEDASIVYPATATTGWMTYTSAGFSTDGMISLTTHIARSTDHGASWTHVGPINATTHLSVVDTGNASLCPGGGPTPCTLTGDLMHETSSLVDDATDPNPARRWKVLTHSYLQIAPATPGGSGTFQFDIGYNGIATAPSPAGPWSAEAKQFGWNGVTAFSSTNALVNLSSIPGMSDCLIAGEPGLMVTPQGLDLALVCIRVETDNNVGSDIELLRSTDHGANWTHVTRMLSGSVAPSMCGSGNFVSGADLYTSGGKEYLTAVTGGNVLNEPGGYNACLMFEVTDPVAGTLKSDANGRPIVERRILGPGNRHSGPCVYAEGASALGYVLTEEYWDGPPLLRNLATGPVTVP